MKERMGADENLLLRAVLSDKVSALKLSLQCFKSIAGTPDTWKLSQDQ